MSEDLEAVRCALAATRSTLARVEAERDRLREALRAVLRALRGAGDDADKADAAYGIAQDALAAAPDTAKEGTREVQKPRPYVSEDLLEGDPRDLDKAEGRKP